MKRTSQAGAPEHKTFALTITATKEIGGEGGEAKEAEFYGEASVFDVKDQGADIVPPGAFTKTLMEKGAVRPLLADHEYKLKSRAGVVYCEQQADALKVRGVLNLEKQFGRDVYSDIKHAQQHGIPIGLSIGYAVVKSHFDQARKARVLDEVKLYEVSLTQFPMNEEAGVTDVKAAFAEYFDRYRESGMLSAEYWAIEDARYMAVDDALYGVESAEARRVELADNLAAYAAALLDWFDRREAFYGQKTSGDAGEEKRLLTERDLLRHQHATIRQSIKALLATEPEAAPEGKAATQPEEAAGAATAPEPPPLTKEEMEALQLKALLASLQSITQEIRA